MTRPRYWIILTVAITGIVLVLMLSYLLNGKPTAAAPPTSSQQTALLPGEIITVCQSGGCDYSAVQSAVDAALPGAVIKVAAGVYTDIHVRIGPVGPLTQSVYLGKSLTIRGGYTTTNGFAGPPDPVAYPTILDARGQGRVLLIVGPVSPTIEALYITGGDATGVGGLWGEQYGGGVYAFDAALTISRCAIVGNAGDNGGGLYTYNSALTLTYSTVASNSAQYLGGGGFLGGGAAILAGNFVDHNAAGTGGGLYLANDVATLTLNVVSANAAQDECGGLMVEVYGGRAALLANTIGGNHAGWRGGGICFGEAVARPGGEGAAIALSGNQIVGNDAGTDGGGAFLSGDGGTPDLSGNSILSNTAGRDGGGIYLDWSSEHTLLADNTIAHNVAYGDGGGLYLGSGDVVVRDNLIQDNWAAGNGGGGCGSGFVEGNVILANSAGGGGGLYLHDAVLVNNWIAANHADDGSGGLYIAGGVSHLLHTTIALNGEGGVWVAGGAAISGAVRLTNTVLVSHNVGITVAPGSAASLEGTLWGNGTDWGGGGSIVTGTVNCWGPPGFSAPVAGDYHLRRGSAAIDVGVTTWVTLDIDGEGRPAGSGPDLGADECWTCPARWFLHLPVIMVD
ncbi:MAG: right-handed parallel beta-helix repeat-containing protein [Anaerolineae bacterium]|nr:right-handed parallel beta-helix repeat-containing protein [Anaerolineae bacterium]